MTSAAAGLRHRVGWGTARRGMGLATRSVKRIRTLVRIAGAGVDRPQGVGWGGVAYQYPPGNWGDKEGRDLSGKGYQELSVWARGVPDKAGRYPVIQFPVGGVSDPSKKYQASFEKKGEFVTLTAEWKRYTISLAKENLSSVISAFTFVVRSEDNPNGATFFLSEIEYR